MKTRNIFALILVVCFALSIYAQYAAQTDMVYANLASVNIWSVLIVFGAVVGLYILRTGTKR